MKEFRPTHTAILKLPVKICHLWKLSNDKGLIDIVDKNNTEVKIFIPPAQPALSKSFMHCQIKANALIYTLQLKYFKERKEFHAS